MAHWEFPIDQVFPADDPVARWLVTLSIALDDLIFANAGMAYAHSDRELRMFFRLSCLHLWELAKFEADSYANWPGIRAFEGALSASAQANAHKLHEVAERGTLTVGTKLVQLRDFVAHYPRMDPQQPGRSRDIVTRSLRALGDEAVTLATEGSVRELRSGHAEAVVARAFLDFGETDEERKELLLKMGEASGAAVEFVQCALDSWLRAQPEGVLRRVG